MRKAVAVMAGIILLLSLPVVASAALMTFTSSVVFPEGQYLEAPDYLTWVYTFPLPPTGLVESGSLSMHLTDDDSDGDGLEAALVTSDEGDWVISEVETDSYSRDIDISYLNDGEYSVRLMATAGDFYLDRFDLTLACRDTDPSPEPATLLLLSSGLVGFWMTKRKNA